jgi:hypothetical protein
MRNQMPPPYSKLIIFSNNVKNIDSIRNKLLNDVASIIVDSNELEDTIEQKIQELGEMNLTHLALLFDNTKSYAPFIEYTAEELLTMENSKKNMVPREITITKRININEESEGQVESQPDEQYLEESISGRFLNNDESSEKSNYFKPVGEQIIEQIYNIPNPDYVDIDPFIPSELMIPDSNNNYKFFSTGFINLIEKIKNNNPQLYTLDIISCNINAHPQFNQVGLTVNYHNEIIGGNNWTLSSDDINLVGLYFNANITEYIYKLGGIQPPLVGSCYTITIPDHLYWLMTYANNFGPAPNLSSDFCLGADIDMTVYAFPSESIGKGTNPSGWFVGTLNGNNYRITIGTVATDFNGLFSTIGGITGFNPIVQNVNVIYTQTSYTLTPPLGGSDLYFGFFAARHHGGQCTNNTVSFSTANNPITVVINNNINGGFVSYAGGLIGSAQTSLAPVITNCSITSTVPITFQVYSPRGCFVGGCVGRIDMTPTTLFNSGIFGSSANFTSLTIQAVRISGSFNTGILDQLYIGGFIGTVRNFTFTPTTTRVFVNNNNFTCTNFIVNTNLPGGVISTNSSQQIYAGGFIGSREEAISINTNTINIGSLNIESTLYLAVMSANIARSFTSFTFGEFINININVNNSIFTANNIGFPSIATYIGNIFGNLESLNNTTLSISNIIYTENTSVFNINNTASSAPINALVGAIGRILVAAASNIAIFLSGISFTSNSMTLSTNVLYPGISFGGFIGSIQGGGGVICSILNCPVNIANISIIRTGVTALYASPGNALTIGGMVGQGRAAINSCTLNVGNMSIVSDVNDVLSVGGVVGILQPPPTTGVGGVSYTIQNNTFNINSINISFYATVPYRRFFYFGGLAAYLQSTSSAVTSTNIRNIINNTLNIQNIELNVTRTAVSQLTGVFSIGGIVGLVNTIGTLPNALNPININNLIANLGSVSFNITNSESNINSGLIIGDSTNMNLTVSNSIVNCNSLNASFLAELVSASVPYGFGTIVGTTGVVRGIYNLNTINIGYLSVILRALDNSTYISLLVTRPSISLFFANNNTINIGPNTYLEVSQIGSDEFQHIIGLLVGLIDITFWNANRIINNTLTIQPKLTMKSSSSFSIFGLANFFSPGGTITNVSNKTYLSNTQYPMVFTTLELVNGAGMISVVVDGLTYQLLSTPFTIKVPTGYNLTYGQYILIFFFADEVIKSPEPITCCTANVCNANPQAANYDNQVVVSSKGGQVLVAAVNNFYAGIAAGQGRPNAPPIFKTYLQMMEWKQRQNRR